MPVEDFDIERYLRNSRRVDLQGIDWEAVPDHPLNDDEVRFLHYAMEIEDHTIVYLKELLRTKAIEDPDVTAFLSCWVYEEHFHGRALERFLHAALGDQAPKRDLARRLKREGRLQRWGKALVMPLLSRFTPDFAAVHMTWGATNELTTLTGYEQIIRRSRHPILKDLLSRIVKDERRHFAFYFQQAKKRLEAEPRMQRINRRLMDRAWRPVGTGVYDPFQVDAVGAYAFGDAAGQEALHRVNRTIASLPGMDGWDRLDDHVAAGARRVLARRPQAVAQ